MSATNRFSRLFKPNAGSDEPSFMPDAGVNPDGAMSMDATGGMMAMDMAPQSAMGRSDEFAGSMLDERAGLDAQTGDQISVPLLGKRSVAQHQRILTILLVIALALLALITFFALSQAGKVAREVAATGDSATQSQRLAKSVSQALVGSAQAFPDVRESSDSLAKNIRGLKNGDSALNLDAVGSGAQEDVDKLMALVDRAEKNSKTVMDQQKILICWKWLKPSLL
jgi:twitching motility protein PilJ